MLDWVQSVSLQVGTTQILKFKWSYLLDSKWRWNHFNQLSPIEIYISFLIKQNNYLKYLSSGALKNTCSESFLQIFIKASVADFVFSKALFWTPLGGCTWIMKIVLW